MNLVAFRGRLLALVMASTLAAGAGGCAPLTPFGRAAPDPAGWVEDDAAAASPREAPPATKADSAVWHAALHADGERIVVSREQKRLWLLEGDSVLFTAAVAVGRDTVFHYGGRAYDFSTPVGKRVVQDKEEMPDWVPPDWHYYELAVARGLKPVHLSRGDRIRLSDSTFIEVRGSEVGRINRFGNWWAFTPGAEIEFDGKIFIPPLGSPQRRIPKILGTRRLILGDGYLIHGTPEVETIGTEASHGCVRLRNPDVERLYGLVAVGTPVYIY